MNWFCYTDVLTVKHCDELKTLHHIDVGPFCTVLPLTFTRSGPALLQRAVHCRLFAP